MSNYFDHLLLLAAAELTISVNGGWNLFSNQQPFNGSIVNSFAKPAATRKPIQYLSPRYDSHTG